MMMYQLLLLLSYLFVHVGVDYEHIEIQPVDQSGRGFLKLKPVGVPINEL